MDKCKHEADINNLQFADTETIISPDKTEFNFVVDALCKKCGASGSFSVTVKYDDINW